jgi:polar amino acid transport system substrate-binding protein
MLKRLPCRLLAGGLLSVSAATAGFGQEPENGSKVPPETLRIGIQESPPYALKGPDGRWTGLNIDLWTRLADEEGLSFIWVEDPDRDPVGQVARGDVDLSMAPVEVRAPDERRIDYGYPYFRKGYGIAVQPDRWRGLAATLEAITSLAFLVTMGILSLLAFVAGTLIWLLERRKNADAFSPAARAGLGNGFWWAVVTMTTVGYGDKTPRTTAGRSIAMLWMYVALILTAVVTAQLTARISREANRDDIAAERDLANRKVGTVRDARSAQALAALGAKVVLYQDINSGLDALSERRVAAFVADSYALTWGARDRENIQLLDLKIGLHDHAMIFPTDSQLRDAINLSLMVILQREYWAVAEWMYPSSELYAGDP